MNIRPTFCRAAAAALALATASFAASAQEQVLNLYSARHYQTDEALYANFTKATGIRINRVDADDAGILARLQSEGAASPADAILLVDAARLWRAEADGLFQPVKSATLEARIPATLRGKDAGNGANWFGLSTRARVIVYNKSSVKKDDVRHLRGTGRPEEQGQGLHALGLAPLQPVAVRRGDGAQRPGRHGNLAQGAWSRTWRARPRAATTDQIKAVASGECQVALTNTYYLARLMRSEKPEDRAVVEKISMVFPNQQGAGTHVNIAGAAVARFAKNRAAAVSFLEYLASDQAQAYFADGNNEWPAVAGVKLANPALEAMGPFKAETIPVSQIGMNQAKVQQILDRVGYK